MATSSCWRCTPPSWCGRRSAAGRSPRCRSPRMVLATVGVLSYFLLVRHIMKGPMLAQILGTFGLALLLRYSAFWYFGANFKTLPDNILGGSVRPRRHPHRGARACWPASIGLVVTLLLHLILTRTAARQPHAGGVGGRDRGAAHGHPARSACRPWPGRWPARLDRHRRRPDRHLLLHLADGRRDAGHPRLRHGRRSAASAACRARWWPA